MLVLHWLIFGEALYCYVVFGIAYSLGEGVPAALDVLIRVALLEEGWQAASVPLPSLHRRCVYRQQNIPTFCLVVLKIPVIWSLTTLER